MFKVIKSGIAYMSKETSKHKLYIKKIGPLQTLCFRNDEMNATYDMRSIEQMWPQQKPKEEEHVGVYDEY
jgi:hypothetical protein